MPKVDRNSFSDAKRVFEKLLPNSDTRFKVENFLGNAICYADTLNSEKWNLNLDLNGNFIRFNVGHEYCIEIISQRILILCNRETLKPILENKLIPVVFRGHIGREIYENENIDKVPDCLAKTKDSIGCVLKTENIYNNIEFFQQANLDFIKAAIKTHQLPQMRLSHSKGVIEYLSKRIDKNVNNPVYIQTELPTLKSFLDDEELSLKKAKGLSSNKRKEILENSNPKPTRTVVSKVVFNRNQYVVAEILFRANGICERCKTNAPFIKDSDDKPYLEVHHKIPLSEGGEDTIENAIALCPNCHRHAHHGKMTY